MLVIPFVASAQRMELYTYNNFKYIALYAYGLPRDVVKTNSEMREAQYNRNGTGVMRRHHTTKGVDQRIDDITNGGGGEGYNCNDKLTFAFMIAPYNVDINGNPTHSKETLLTWSEASGWDTAIDSEIKAYDESVGGTGIGDGESELAAEPTGCAAYKGMNGMDEAGDWRLPTQRELQVMFTVIEQSYGHIVSGAVTHEILEGYYWSSTEFYASGATGHAWSIYTATGRPQDDPKSIRRMARCVKDIYETIND